MFLKIAQNEFKYMLKSPQTIVGFAVFFLLPFFAMISPNISIGGGGNILVNSPYAIMQTLLTMSVFAIFLAPAYIANSILKDVDHRMDGIIFSTPITKPAYLAGRFTGAFMAMMVTLLSIPLGMLIGTFWPNVDPETLGSTNIGHYAYVFLGLMAPGMLAISSIMFAVTAITRSVMYTYLSAMGLLVLYFIGFSYFTEPTYREIMAIVDPFMVNTFQEVTRYWTAAERNSLLLDYEGLILTNRILWGAVSIGFIGIAYALFSFRAPARLGKSKSDGDIVSSETMEKAPRITPNWNKGYQWAQFVCRTSFEVRSVIMSLPFLIIVGFGLALILSAFLGRNVGYGLDAYPVTRLMVQSIEGLGLALLVVIIFYTADIIWRERTSGIYEIIDATPTSGLVFVLSKLFAIAVVLTTIGAIGIFIAIMVQVLSGYTAIEIDLYLQRGFAYFIYQFLLATVWAVFIQVLVKNRFVGMMIMVVYLIGTIILTQLGFEHPLYFPGSGIATPLSDMNGNGRFLAGDMWIKAYWTFFSVLLLMASYMLWNRGTLQPLSYRIRHLKAFRRPLAAGTAAIALMGFTGTGSFIFYNTNILNEYVTADRLEELQVSYEKKYRQYENLPMPRITHVKMNVDIYPYEQRVVTKGEHILENKNADALDVVHMMFSPDLEILSVELEGATIESADDRFKYYILRLDIPMQPGEKRKLTFETLLEEKGFTHNRNSVLLVRNGTFINGSDITPLIGFGEGGMIQDRNTRRQYGLEPLPRMPKLEDESKYGRNGIRPDSDFVTYETTVSTVASQTAIAPGYLQKEWEENGRRYFHYKMDTPILNFYSYLSADYEVIRDKHGDIDIEVYHHEPHTYNTSRMIESVKDSLDYFSSAFSPYQHKQVRILEFPAYRSFAQAFPNTIPYSEGIGFIADHTDEKDIDLAYYVTAHEMAHQWWAHQVMPAYTQGGTFIVETLAQYSALLVMEQKYGKDQMRKFLKFELDRYLRNRASDPEGELPLYRVEGQNYIHYRKGAVVMYALRDYLGETMVNYVLSRLVKEHGFKSDPYPTTLDFLRILREEAGQEHDQLITDLFERITLFDLKAEEAKVEVMPDGKFKVTLAVEASKFEADNQGVETKLQLADMIDIGAFTTNPDDGNFNASKVIYMQKHMITKDTKSIEIIVDRKPLFIGVDPYNKLIDRNSNDNIRSITVMEGSSSSD